MIWKPIYGYEDAYEVSDTGQVRSKPGGHRLGKLLKLQTSTTGYFYFTVYKPRFKKITVHRAVAETFLGISDKKEVNHKDCNKKNNNVSNLEYVTHKENMEHALRSGVLPLGEKHRGATITESKAREVKSYPRTFTAKQVAEKCGVNVEIVNSIRTRKSWTWLDV